MYFCDVKTYQLFQRIFLFLALLATCTSWGQQKHTLSGYISDKSTGEELINAKIVVTQLGIGAYTNEFGFYSISLPVGTYLIDFRYSSYNTVSQSILLDKNLKLNISLELNEKVQQIGEVEVIGAGRDVNITNNQIS